MVGSIFAWLWKRAISRRLPTSLRAWDVARFLPCRSWKLTKMSRLAQASRQAEVDVAQALPGLANPLSIARSSVNVHNRPTVAPSHRSVSANALTRDWT